MFLIKYMSNVMASTMFRYSCNLSRDCCWLSLSMKITMILIYFASLPFKRYSIQICCTFLVSPLQSSYSIMPNAIGTVLLHFYIQVSMRPLLTRARICKPLRSPGTDSQPGGPAGNLFDVPACQST
jgi:hypothetical protein